MRYIVLFFLITACERSGRIIQCKNGVIENGKCVEMLIDGGLDAIVDVLPECATGEKIPDGGKVCVKTCNISNRDEDCKKTLVDGGFEYIGKCDPVESACTIPTGNAIGCVSCTNNEICAPNFRCLPTHFNDAEAGNYCFEIRPDSGCTRPFGREKDADVFRYCGINETVNTCSSFNRHNNSCSGGCGESGTCIDLGIDAGTGCRYSCVGNAEMDCSMGEECSFRNVVNSDASISVCTTH